MTFDDAKLDTIREALHFTVGVLNSSRDSDEIGLLDECIKLLNEIDDK